MLRNLFISLFFYVIFSGLAAQEVFNIPYYDVEINFDGRPDEAIWADGFSLEFTMHQPVFGKEPTEKTECMMFFNDEYLYVGANLYYSDITLLSDVGRQRDYFSDKCDWFGILLDTFNDHENAVTFYTTPSGLRYDASLMNDCSQGMEDINLSWNTFWDVLTTIDDKGWYVEMQIPISSLRFQAEGDIVKMGLGSMRFISRTNEGVTFPAVDPKYNFATWKPSLTAPIEFRGLKPGKPIYLTPYLIGGVQRNNELNDAETSYESQVKPRFDAGLDFKYGITNNLTLDLTVNTDFAQVEADEQQINLTRFSLFFPEKRPFFMEKSDVFDFDLMGGNKLFYSRRIGLYEGEPVRILGGARLTGRLGEWDLGILDMQTDRFNDISSENFGVFRTKRSVFNQNSYIGAMFTSRLGADGTYNLAYGLDGVIRLFADDYFTVRWAQTFEDGNENKFFSADPSRLLARWERRSQSGIRYDLLYTWSGTQFNPGVGFEVKDNYFGARGILGYGWIPGNESSWLRKHNISLITVGLFDSGSNELETIMSKTGWEFESRTGQSGSVILNFNREIVSDSLDFNRADVPPGNYSFLYLSTILNLGPQFNPGLGLTAEAGQFYDGYKLTLELQPTWNISTGLDINPTYRIDYVNFEKRNQSFTNHILGLKALAMFSTQLSLTNYIQYNTAVDLWLINIRLRYNPREGNDLYIVYNEGLNTQLEREIPSLPRSSNRTLLLKYTYTFGF